MCFLINYVSFTKSHRNLNKLKITIKNYCTDKNVRILTTLRIKPHDLTTSRLKPHGLTTSRFYPYNNSVSQKRDFRGYTNHQHKIQLKPRGTY